MSEVTAWATSAGSNTQSPPNGWPENTMTFGQVNDTAREMMAVIARWFRDSVAYNVACTMPVQNQYSVTINRTITSYSLDLAFRFRPPSTNTGASTINVNGLGNRTIVYPDGTHLRWSELSDFVDVFYHPNDVFVISNLVRRPRGEFGGGADGVSTGVLFGQPSAPTGWTQYTGWNDRLLRVVSGTGAGAGGAWGITGLSNESANHTHTLSITSSNESANHTHSVTGSTGNFVGTTQGTNPTGGSQTPINTHYHDMNFTSSGQSNSHSHGVTGTTAGISNGHTHYGDGNWRPAYADVILAFKQ